MPKHGMIYFRDGELLYQSGEVRAYRFMNKLHLEIGPGHNLWAIETELEDYIWQINDKPKGDCLEIGLGLGVASKYILSCPKVKSLTTVELREDVIEVQRQVNTIVDRRHAILNCDGLTYMYATDRKFDFVFVDCYDIIDEDTLPMIADYAHACRKVLNDGGVAIGWFDKETPEEFVEDFYGLWD
jgi:hypothetical protein